MANIQQAAKWMQEGKLVRRPWRANISLGIPKGKSGPGWILVYEDGMRARDRRTASFDASDLTAEDWEIAQ